MVKESEAGPSGFEPPKYLSSLIAAVNEGAKAAQAGSFLFLLVGLYLLATALSATDEDLLLGKTVTISQIGASLPANFSFAIAPLVFVFLHIYALVRYDMLAANVRQFSRELRETVPRERDRERCRQLLANVEFIDALTAPRGSPLYSAAWPRLFKGIAAVFPVVVLLLVQINALRYQSYMILWVQRAWLLVDLLALIWFFHRNILDGSAGGGGTTVRRSWRVLVRLPVIVMTVNFLYIDVVRSDADPDFVRYDASKTHGWTGLVLDAVWQPLDAVVCPQLNWGCRFLRVEHRTLVDKVWDVTVMAKLRDGSEDRTKSLTALEGVVLRERSLRFAVLDESRMYGIDLIGADLRKASALSARLVGARMAGAQMQDADLRGAQMQDADLRGAQMQGADLVGAQMQDADLRGAQMQGADLRFAQMQDADLGGAQMQGADLVGAQLQGADLRGAQLQGADLSAAQLQGADLFGAQLQGADLSAAQLQGADLRSSNLWHARAPAEGRVVLTLADLRGAVAEGPPSEDEISKLRQSLQNIPDGDAKQAAERRLQAVLAPKGDVPELAFVATREKSVLAPASLAPPLAGDTKWLTGERGQDYIAALAEYLGDTLATSDAAIARGIDQRAEDGLGRTMEDGKPDVESRQIGAAIACRLLAGHSLPQAGIDDLQSDLTYFGQPPCPPQPLPAVPAVPAPGK